MLDERLWRHAKHPLDAGARPAVKGIFVQLIFEPPFEGGHSG